MKELLTKEQIKTVQLSILDEIDAFCQENGLR